MQADEIIEQLKNYFQVYIFDEDIKLYHKYMSELPKEAHVMDLATGWGKAVAAMALANPKVEIETIDNGELVMSMGWARNEEHYKHKLQDLFEPYHIHNVEIIVGNIMTHKPKHQYDLINMDLDAKTEQKALKRWIKYLKPGGIFMVRNHFRFREEAAEILKDFEYLEDLGQIQVVRK